MRPKPKKLKFTEAALAKLPAPTKKKRETYWDTGQPKHAFRITDRNARAFYGILRQSESGKVVFHKIANFEDITVESSRKAVQRLLGTMAHGTDLAVQKAARRAEPTLGELAADYFAWRKTEGHRNVEDDKAELWERWVGELPDLPPKKHSQKAHEAAGRGRLGAAR